MKKHDFTNQGWGNRLENSGACWSQMGAVRSGDFMKIKKVWYKVIEAEPCGNPWDMSFVKKYVNIGEEEDGEVPTVDELEEFYQKYKDSRKTYSFPLEDTSGNI